MCLEHSAASTKRDRTSAFDPDIPDDVRPETELQGHAKKISPWSADQEQIRCGPHLCMTLRPTAWDDLPYSEIQSIECGEVGFPGR
jgi:hypothetical protein